MRRVVEEQDDPQTRVLLERRRQQGLTDDVGLLAVRRHEHCQRRRVAVERAVDLDAARAMVLPRAVERAEAGEQVCERRRGEERRHADVEDGVDRVADAQTAAEERLGQGRDGERDPPGDRHEDREPRQADRADARAPQAVGGQLPGAQRPPGPFRDEAVVDFAGGRVEPHVFQ
jgi:hypothetical protein